MAIEALVLLRKMTATRSWNGLFASSSCINPKTGLERGGATTHEIVPAAGRAFFTGEGVAKNCEVVPVLFLGMPGTDFGLEGVLCGLT